MTASASNSKTLSANYGSYTLSVSWSESSPTVSNNKSKISASATLSSSNTAFDSASDAAAYQSHISVYWFDNNKHTNGVKIDGTDFRSCGISPYGSRSASGEIWVEHKDDGTLKGYCVTYFTNNNGGPYAPSSNSCSTSEKSLDTIARASVPTCSPATLTIGASGGTLSVSTNRKSSSFTHTIKVQCGSWSWTSSARSVGSSTNVTIPYSVIAQFSATSKTATATITCTTFSGTTQIGSAKTCTCTFQINTSVDHPNVGTATFTEGNSRVAAIVNTQNTFVQGISTLVMSVPFTVSGSYTQLEEARISNGSENVSYVLSGTSGTITYTSVNIRTTWLTITAYDKRGTTAVSKPSWTLLPYTPLTATATVGRPSATGSVAVGQIEGVAYGGDYGQSTNSLTISYRYKEHDASSWTDGAETFTRALNSGWQTYTYAMTFSEAFDYQKQYDVEFSVSDLFSTATYTAQLMQGLPILSWDETEVDVWGSLHIHNREKPNVYQNVMDGFDAVLAHGAQKNLAVYDPRTATVNGITYQIYANGEVKVTGTATAYSSCNVGVFTAVDGVEYILNGCPDGGGERTYSVGVGSVHDYGEGATVTGSGLQNIYIDVFAGETVDITIYPMVRDARIANEDYETPLLCTRVFTSNSVTVNANSSTSTNIPITVPSGYRVLAILRTWTNGDILTNYISTSTQSLQQGQTTVTAWVRNPKSSASNVTVSVEVLFIRA